MIDVSRALEYLHYGRSTSIVGCDQPSNIVLEEVVAHLNDCGIAKLLGEGDSTTQIQTPSTTVYIAPGCSLLIVAFYFQLSFICLHFHYSVYRFFLSLLDLSVNVMNRLWKRRKSIKKG